MASKNTKKSKNTNNKTSVGKTILISLVALILGALIGYLGSNVFVNNDLQFNLVGESSVSVSLGNTYNDQGVVCIYRGTDYSDDVILTYYDENLNIVSEIDTTSVATYYVVYNIWSQKFSSELTRVVNVVEFDDLEINFMMLGNKYAGDSIYIKAGDTDILVDAGSRKSSASTIKEYLLDSSSSLHSYVSDGKLEYVIATHADQDHIAAFVGTKDKNGNRDGILSSFDIDTIIEFPKTEGSSLYNEYRELVDNLEDNGTKVYTALECFNEENGASRVIQVAAGIEIEILYNYYYEHETSNENNYSVCFMLRRGEEQYLFTGDLENEGKAEQYLVENNNLGEVYFYKMGHHGSKTSSSMELLSVIKPQVVVATCAAFVKEYNVNSTDNLFPTKAAIDNLVEIGTVKHFYVPTMLSTNEEGYEPANGHIVVKANSNGTYVECSHSNEVFYNFDIFKQYRSWTTN